MKRRITAKALRKTGGNKMSDIESKGHRQRLRERFTRGEDNSRSEEAILELLLTYAIPQKDVQPLAKGLLAEYGSLKALLASPIEKLVLSNGVKEGTAVLLKLVDWICQDLATRQPVKAAPEVMTQAASFECLPQSLQHKEEKSPVSIKEAFPCEKLAKRNSVEIFGKAVLKEAINILPVIPLTSSIKEITEFLNNNLPFNSEQTRARRGRYIKYNMFHEGIVDISLLKFARAFPESRELKDVCFYKFCCAQPLMVEFVENVILTRIGAGFITRAVVEDYLRERFPGFKAVKDGTAAISEALFGAEIASRKGKKIIFSLRAIPLKALNFVLHSEYPEPGMYDIRKLEENRIVKALLWNPELLLNSLYELRNLGIISRISEIDNVRQFTTKWRLEEAVVRITS